MEYKSPSIRKESEKPDWKQWIPLYGIVEMHRANYANKSNVAEDASNSAMYVGKIVYHGIATGAITAAFGGLVQIIGRLI